MAHLQFSHTHKMGFIIDPRKPPSPSPKKKNRKKPSSSCLRKNSCPLNGIFCAKEERVPKEGWRAEGATRVGEGVCRLGFVWMAGRDEERWPYVQQRTAWQWRRCRGGPSLSSVWTCWSQVSLTLLGQMYTPAFPYCKYLFINGVSRLQHFNLGVHTFN